APVASEKGAAPASRHSSRTLREFWHPTPTSVISNPLLSAASGVPNDRYAALKKAGPRTRRSRHHRATALGYAATGRPAIVFVPVVEAELDQVYLACEAARRSKLIADFIRVAKSLLIDDQAPPDAASLPETRRASEGRQRAPRGGSTEIDSRNSSPCLSLLSPGQSAPAVEALDPATAGGGVLHAGVGRVAVRADVDGQRRGRRADRERCAAACADDVDEMRLRMLRHGQLLSFGGFVVVTCGVPR